MNRLLRFIVIGILTLSLIPAAAGAQPAVEPVLEGCVETYDPAINYFPVEMDVNYATGFEIEYHNHYKVISVTDPWQGAETVFQYVLVQCGTPAPDLEGEYLVIEVPVARAISMSTTYIPHFVDLDLVDRLVATDETDFIYSPEVRERIDAGEIAEIGGSSAVNVELTLDLEPDIIFTYGSGFPEYDAHPALLAAGLNVALNGDYMEETPLGRAEWIKFTAAFFNREAEANAVFDAQVEQYTRLADLAASVEQRPTVLVNAMYSGTWYVSGGGSFIAQMIDDAGGSYLFADEPAAGGIPLDFEVVLDRAQDADFWLNPNFWYSLADGLAEDERYAEFDAFQNDRVFNSVARTLPTGANDYFERGATHPELILADLIAIFHPDLLPDHDLMYFVQLQ